MLAAGDFGGGHRHDRAGDVAVAPAGHVAARRRHRDRLLPGDKARRQLGLDIGQRAFLKLGKTAHVVMGKADVSLEPVGHLVAGRRDLVRRQQHIALVAVEARGILQRLGIAAGFDLVQDARDGVMGLARVGLWRAIRLLQIVARHRMSSRQFP